MVKMNSDRDWWQRQRNWANNLIPSNYSSRARRSGWVFFIFLLLFTGFILYEEHLDLLDSYNQKDYSGLMPLVVILFPILFLVQQIKRGLGRSRFGETPFFMNPFPGVLGEKFSGSIEIKETIDATQFGCELLLKQNVEAEQGDNKNTQDYIVWKMPLEIISERSHLGTRLLISGRLPMDKPASQPNGANSYFWRLYLFSQDKKFKRTWDVPIVASSV